MRNFNFFLFLTIMLFFKIFNQVPTKENQVLTTGLNLFTNSTLLQNLDKKNLTDKNQMKIIEIISNSTKLPELTTQSLNLTKEHIFDYQFREYVYCGKDSEVILVITENNKLKRTIDKGITWNDINLQVDILSKLKIEEVNVSKIKISPSEPDTILILGYKGLSWISTDCGGVFNTFLNPIVDYIFHPFESKWGLAITNGEGRSQNLLLTLDKGTNWKMIAQNVVQVGW